MPSAPPVVLVQEHDFVRTLLDAETMSTGVRFELVPDIRLIDLTSPEVQAAELSFARHLMRLAMRDRSWVAIPAFVQRGFTHRSWYVREESDYRAFPQLVGKRIGISEWGATGNTWARAVARDGGLGTRDVEWRVGAVDGGYVNTTDRLPGNAEYHDDGSLTNALLERELDAVVCPDPPSPFHWSAPSVRRLLSDFRAAERAFFTKTGVFPGHHVVGVKREVYDEAPQVLADVFEALSEAKDTWSRLRLAEGDTAPWLLAELEDAARLMGDDWRPYGTEPNRAMVEYLCREMFAQQLIAQEVSSAVVFEEFDALRLEAAT